MKKYINTAFVYALAAMAGGVFYREFTKFNGFEGRTALGFVHLHLMVLGCFLFLLVALFSLQTDLTQQKQFGLFYRVYNIGLPCMTVMLAVRGILQVLGTPLSKGANAAISGISGLAHIAVGTALVLLFLALRKCKARG